MVVQDFELEQTALKLRDAFRVLAWQHFRPQTELSERYTQFTSRWNKSAIRSMDCAELIKLAAEKGLSIEQLLLIRSLRGGTPSNYYGLYRYRVVDNQLVEN